MHVDRRNDARYDENCNGILPKQRWEEFARQR